MPARKLPEASVLHKLLSLDASSGRLYWKVRSPDLFCANSKWTAEQVCAAWNKKNAGREAMVRQRPDGMLTGRILGVQYLAHRVVFAMVHGFEPEEVDHIDHNRRNNAPSNLRAVSHRQNALNVPLKKNNKSGFCGVCRRGSKWIAQIRDHGKVVYLGAFDDLEDAIAARVAANKSFGYHPNHGVAI